MLKPVKQQHFATAGGHFAIVASRYNSLYVDGMLRAAEETLTGAKVASLKVVRVPGAFEIPVVAAKLARASPPPAAVICLGVVMQGETSHAQHIGTAITEALVRIQVETEVPIIHEVLLFDHEDQARVRCLDPEHNRGGEAAQTGLAMAEVIAEL